MFAHKNSVPAPGLAAAGPEQSAAAAAPASSNALAASEAPAATPLEPMSAFFAARVSGYDAHMLEDVQGCREGYARMAELVDMHAKSVSASPLRLLDLGCGTGALALLVWRPDLTITGLELQDGPLDLFRQSIAANELENVTALQGDLRQMRTLLPHGSMDYVICNPPYFDRNAGANAPTAEKRTARQDATCSVEELAVAASFVLHTGGKAAFVFRPERLWVLLEALSRVRLVPKRMRFVHQSVQAAPSVVMVECRKGGSAEGLVVEPPLIVESDEYFRIYGIEH